MNKYSIQAFIQETKQDDTSEELFQLEKPNLLKVNLNNQSVMMKKGAMVAYTGDVKYEREGILSKGVGNLLKKAMSGEGTSMMHASGTGCIYVADLEKRIRILYLENESLYVNGNDILVHENGIKSDVKMMKSVAGIIGGGLFQVKLEGTGYIAISTHGHPLTLQVKPGHPVYTDPNATVAWSSGLQPEIKADVSLKTFVGRGSGESIQMKFVGEGWVIVQPYEETYQIEK